MNNYRKLIYNLMIPMVLILPFWLTFGRAFLGSSGWLTFTFLFSIVPMLLILLSAINGIIRGRSDVKVSKLPRPAESLMLGAFYILTILFGFFLVDGGDTPESGGSVITHFFGRGLEHASDQVAGILLISSAVLLAIILIFEVYEGLKRK